MPDACTAPDRSGKHPKVLPAHERLQTGSTELGPEPGAAPATVRCVRDNNPPAVDCHSAATQCGGGLEAAAMITAADIVDKPVVGSVGLSDLRGRVGQLHHSDNRCKGFFVDEAHPIAGADITDKCGGDPSIRVAATFDACSVMESIGNQ